MSLKSAVYNQFFYELEVLVQIKIGGKVLEGELYSKEIQWTLVIVNNLSLVNIFGETGRLFYNIKYMLNSEHLSLVNKIGDKTEFTITRVHCTLR